MKKSAVKEASKQTKTSSTTIFPFNDLSTLLNLEQIA
jgi:hypothetical protein